MRDKFIKYISENHLADGSDKILLAVSGGIDSMVMAHLFISTFKNTGIAHCNFGLRGAESELDEALVREFSKDNELPFYRKSFDTTGYSKVKGISIQMAARDLRYSWFEDIRAKNGYNYIAIAHNLNDVVETFLLNLSRGTGISGLAGIKPRQKNIIRPLLFASRHEIIEYQKQYNIKFREDSSNSETKYTRNKIRHSIIPLFREINPSFDNTIIETARRFSETENLLSAFIRSIEERALHMDGQNMVIKLDPFSQEFENSTILFELFRKYGIGPSQLGELEKLVKAKTGSCLNTGTHRLIKDRNRIIITAAVNGDAELFTIEKAEDLLLIPFIDSVEFSEYDKNFKIPREPDIACLDAELASFPFLIRKWEKGDTFYPLGMNGKKKISDYLIDRKIPLPDKENTYVVVSKGNIIWVVGERIDNRYRVTPSTHDIIIIRKKKTT